MSRLSPINLAVHSSVGGLQQTRAPGFSRALGERLHPIAWGCAWMWEPAGVARLSPRVLSPGLPPREKHPPQAPARSRIRAVGQPVLDDELAAAVGDSLP